MATIVYCTCDCLSEGGLSTPNHFIGSFIFGFVVSDSVTFSSLLSPFLSLNPSFSFSASKNSSSAILLKWWYLTWFSFKCLSQLKFLFQNKGTWAHSREWILIVGTMSSLGTWNNAATKTLFKLRGYCFAQTKGRVLVGGWVWKSPFSRFKRIKKYALKMHKNA